MIFTVLIYTIVMEATIQNGPQPKGKKEQTQIVNEQDQQERLNPGGEEFQPAAEKKAENSENSFDKTKQPGLMENQPGLEEGNTYEDDPKKK